jgi:NADPH:quinone reductase
MPHAIRIHGHGGPEVLEWESIEIGEPGPGEVRLRHSAVGLNFIDVYERIGLYPTASFPFVPGREAAGIVEAVGAGVKHVRAGDRAAYVSQAGGAYCESRIISADSLVQIPQALDDRQAAAIMLKGLTTQVLLRQTWRVRKNDVVLIHAAAGGVGSLAVQWARHLGAIVIALVGSAEKARRAAHLGAQHVLLTQDDWVREVRTLTNGRGVDVVYDSVGKDTFMSSLDCLRPRGLMVSYGNASGPVPPVAPLELGKRGSLYLTRPSLFHHIPTRAALSRAARELFAVIAAGAVTAEVGQTYPLQDAARAHRDLEARRTVGSTVLLI